MMTSQIGRLSLNERIRLNTKRSKSGCLLWTGNCNDDGYALMKKGGKNYGVHRLVLAQKLRRPLKKQALHTCDTPACVNENHLYEGTPLDNARDRKNRGRGGYLKGSSNGRAKLTERKVKKIKASLRLGITQSVLANRYDVSLALISFINSGQNWSHV